MIDELRIYRLMPGALPDYLKFSGGIAVPFRGDRFGALLGFWFAEIGAANTAFSLWRHQDLNSRQALRAEMAKNEVWTKEYQPRIQPLIQRQEIRLMTPVVSPSLPDAATGRTFEVRFIRTKAGKAPALAARLQDDMPASFREETVALWTTIAGPANEVVHLSAFPDVHARLKRSLTGEDWRRFLGQHAALVEDIDSSLLLSADHSPLK
jgi:NIPSNAP